MNVNKPLIRVVQCPTGRIQFVRFDYIVIFPYFPVFRTKFENLKCVFVWNYCLHPNQYLDTNYVKEYSQTFKITKTQFRKYSYGNVYNWLFSCCVLSSVG